MSVGMIKSKIACSAEILQRLIFNHYNYFFLFHKSIPCFYTFMRNLPVEQILHMRKALFIKDCLNCGGILKILSLISSNSNEFVDLCYMYNVHCGMKNDQIKCNIETVFANNYG